MPQFEKGTIAVTPRPGMRLNLPKREAPPTTDKSPTLKALMALPESQKTKAVYVPLVTRVGSVKFDPIWLNTVKFEPGQTYRLHPMVAAELLRAIDNYEQVPIKQMTGNIEENALRLEDVMRRKHFEEEEQKARLADALEEASVKASK